MTPLAHVVDITTELFEAEVVQKSLNTPVLVEFWAHGWDDCKTLGLRLEKLAGEYGGSFVLAKVDAQQELQIAAAFRIQSVPSVFLVKNGQPVNGFEGVMTEGQLHEFLKQNGIEPVNAEATPQADPVPQDPHAEVLNLRKAVEAEPDKAELKLDLALALLRIGAAAEVRPLLDALPANLATDARALRANARLAFIEAAKDAPPAEVLEAAIASDPADLRARHLLGVQLLLAQQDEAALEQFLEMLWRDRAYADGLARKSLIDAFLVVEDDDLIGRYRRRMSSLLLS